MICKNAWCSFSLIIWKFNLKHVGEGDWRVLVCDSHWYRYSKTNLCSLISLLTAVVCYQTKDAYVIMDLITIIHSFTNWCSHYCYLAMRYFKKLKKSCLSRTPRNFLSFRYIQNLPKHFYGKFLCSYDFLFAVSYGRRTEFSAQGIELFFCFITI